MKTCAVPGGKACLQFPAAAAALIALANCASALTPGLSLTQYLHTSWTQMEGAVVPGVEALAQTSDGYLWLGTAQGLLRFDGLRFAAWKPPQGEKLPGEAIKSLAASADGGLWIGTESGIAKLRDGHLVPCAGGNVLTSQTIAAMLEDRAGRLWAGSAQETAAGLVLIEKGTVKTFGWESGLPGLQVPSLFQDRGGTIWVGTSAGFCRWNGSRAEQCRLTSPGDRIDSITGDAAGNLFLAGVTSGILRFANGRIEPASGPLRNDFKALLREHDGNLWIGTMNRGLLCLRNGGTEHFTRRDGLSSDEITAMFEDREGNLWVGTANGLDRFRQPKVARWSTQDGLAGNSITAVCATRDGDVWVAAVGGGLSRVRGNRVTTYAREAGLPPATVLSLYEDARGTLWAGTTGGLGYLSHNRFVEIRGTAGTRLTRVFAITAGRSGGLWLADAQRGLWQLQHGLPAPAKPDGLPPGKSIYQLHTSRGGDLWIGYHEGGIAVVSGGSVHSYDPPNGLAAGPVQAIYEDSLDNAWVGTGQGLSRFRKGHWTTWTTAQGLPEGGIQAIGEDTHGHLWLVTAAGLLALELSGLERIADGAPQRLAFATYGPGDGIRPAKFGMSGPRIARSRDGRLWIDTQDGVASIDPGTIRTNTLPPPVAIEHLLVDGKPLELRAREIGLRGRAVQFEYTALSLTQPESIRFRYKLEGFDKDWVEAGTRRQIVYANLPPRHYRFRVIACNNDGVWNRTGAALAFRAEPYFYQTWLFLALCASAAGLAGYGGHRLRLRQLRSGFRLVLQERTRVTREMHDTILQGFAGVVFQLEAASRQMANSPEAGKRRMDLALEQADRSLREARQALSAMRISALENSTLPEALRTASRQIVEGTPIRFDMAVTGKARELPYDVQANLFIIAREAMTNAMNHGKPQRITLELVYAAHEVRLAVQDDGVGFDPQAAAAKNNHWGLAGMSERARQMAACLTVDSVPGQGTRLEVVVGQKGSRRLRR
ncbi:MAG: ATP-binding protein [Acidobacteriia bacterium]|nr:ATP-binding protein [Terriglobia bacterium]